MKGGKGGDRVKLGAEVVLARSARLTCWLLPLGAVSADTAALACLKFGEFNTLSASSYSDGSWQIQSACFHVPFPYKFFSIPFFVFNSLLADPIYIVSYLCILAISDSLVLIYVGTGNGRTGCEGVLAI